MRPDAPAPSAGQAQRLAAGLEALGLALDPDQQTRVLAYLDLLARWNRVYNLTAIRDPGQMLVQHLLDSLAVVPVLDRWFPLDPARTGLSLLDVGSGAGLPGLMIALARPTWQVDMVEPVGKKSAFIQQAIGELGLGHARSLGARAEQLSLPATQADGRNTALTLARAPDFIISRAFASLDTFATACASVLGPHTRLVAMKGRVPEAEIAGLSPPWRVDRVEPLQVPELDAERHLLLLSRSH